MGADILYCHNKSSKRTTKDWDVGPQYDSATGYQSTPMLKQVGCYNEVIQQTQK
jgi:hypothetical protein